MLLKLSHINLYSINPESLAHFLTSIFEIEVYRDKAGGLGFQIEETNFVIHTSSSHRKRNGETIFDLSFDEVFNLDEMRNKVEFFKYTSHNDNIQVNAQNEKILISDIDGRIWRISQYLQNHEIVQSKEKTENQSLM